MDNKLITYSKKIPKKQPNDSTNSPVSHVKPVPFGIIRPESTKIDKLNLNNITQTQVLKLDSLRSPERGNRSPLRSDLYQKYTKVAQTRSPKRRDNQENLQTLKSGRVKKFNQIKTINRRISSLVHTMLENLNKNKYNMNDEDKRLNYKNESTERNNFKKLSTKGKILPSLNISSTKFNEEILLNTKLNSLINDKNLRQLEKTISNEKEEMNLKSINIKDKLSENFVTFLKKHRYSTLLIGSKRYEGKSGEYYLNTQIKDTSNNRNNNDKSIVTSSNQDTYITPQKIKKIEIDFGIKAKFERNWEIPSVDLDLTPIPTKRNFVSNNSLARDEYTNAERTAVLIRRIEYSLKLKGVKKKFTEEMREGMYLKSKIILIQNWWRKMNKYLSFRNRNALMIQKIFRGYFTRKALTFIIKDFNRFIYFTEKIQNIIQNFIKKLVLNYLYLKFAHLSQAKYVRNKIDLIRKNFLNFYYKKKFQRKFLIDSSARPILLRIKSVFNSLKDFYNCKSEVLIIQTNWRGFLLRNNDLYFQMKEYNPLLKVFLKYKFSSKYYKVKKYAMEVIDKFKRSLLMLRFNKKIPILLKKLKKLCSRKFYRFFIRKMEEYRFVKLRLKILVRSLKEIFPIYHRFILDKYFKVLKNEYKSVKSTCNKIKYLYRAAFKFIYWNKFKSKLISMNVEDKLRHLFRKQDMMKLKYFFGILLRINRNLFFQQSKLTNILNSKHYIQLKFNLEKLRKNSDNRVEEYLYKYKNINEGIILLEKIREKLLHNVIKTYLFLPYNNIMNLKTFVKLYSKYNYLESLRYYLLKFLDVTKKVSNKEKTINIGLKQLVLLKSLSDSLLINKKFKKYLKKCSKLKSIFEKHLFSCFQTRQHFELFSLKCYFNNLKDSIRKLNFKENIKKHLIRNDIDNLRIGFKKISKNCKELRDIENVASRNKNVTIIFSLLHQIINDNIFSTFKEVFYKNILFSQKILRIIKENEKKELNYLKIYWIRKYFNLVIFLNKKVENERIISLILRNHFRKHSFKYKILLSKFFSKFQYLTNKSNNKDKTSLFSFLYLVRKSYLNSLNKYFNIFKDFIVNFPTRDNSLKHIFSLKYKKELKYFFGRMKENCKKNILINKVKGVFTMINKLLEIINCFKKDLLYYNLLNPYKRYKIFNSIFLKKDINNMKMRRVLSKFINMIRVDYIKDNNLRRILVRKIGKEKNYNLNYTKFMIRLWRERVNIVKFKYQSFLNLICIFHKNSLYKVFNIFFQTLKENIKHFDKEDNLEYKDDMKSQSISKLKAFLKRKLTFSNLKHFYKYKLIINSLKIKEDQQIKSMNNLVLFKMLEVFILNETYTSKQYFFDTLKKKYFIGLIFHNIDKNFKLFINYCFETIKNFPNMSKNENLLKKLKVKYLKIIVNRCAVNNNEILQYYFSNFKTNSLISKKQVQDITKKECDFEYLYKKRLALYRLISKSKLCYNVKCYFSFWVKTVKIPKIHRKFTHNLSSLNDILLNSVINIFNSQNNTFFTEFFKELKNKIYPTNNYKGYLTSKGKNLPSLFKLKITNQNKIISKHLVKWRNNTNKSKLNDSANIIQKTFKTFMNDKRQIKNESIFSIHKQILFNIFESLKNQWKLVLKVYFIKFKKAVKSIRMLQSIIKFQNNFHYRAFHRKFIQIRNSKRDIKIISKDILRKTLLSEIKELKRVYNNMNVLLYISKVQKSKLIVILRTYFNNIEMSFRFFWMIECIRKKYKQLYNHNFFRRIYYIYMISCVKFIQIYWKIKIKLTRNRKINEVLNNALYEQTYLNLKALKNRFLKWLKEVHTYKLRKSISIINRYVYVYIIKKRLKNILQEYLKFLPVKITMNFLGLAKEMFK